MRSKSDSRLASASARAAARLLGGLALLLVSSTAQADSLDDRIGELANGYVDSGVVPGILIGISRPGSAPRVITRGVSDTTTGAPMAAANAQRIGSITKSFTVTRVLQLADDGRLSLDDPLEKYVPGVRNGDATLRELANMTSGIFNYTEDQAFVLDFAFHRTKVFTDRQIVAIANRHPPSFAPGAGWHYSNTNTVLLGMVVERVTGRSLRQEITRHLIRPLGLTRTSYPQGVFLPPPFTHGYATLDLDAGRIDVSTLSPSALSGAGAMISTFGDLVAWGRALAQGTLVSRRAQRERLRTIDSSQGVGPFYDRYGLGLGRIDGWLGHTADVLGYQSLVMHNLVANTTVVIFVNASNSDHVPTDLFQKITGLLPVATPARRPSLRLIGPRARTTSAGTVRLRGRAGSPAGILLVEASGPGAPSRVARGRNHWRIVSRLQPGRNILSVTAIDRLGRTSVPAKITVIRN